MINEELLSILLGREVEELRQISNMIHYEWVIPLDGCIFGEAINIYEVAYKCKEWALSKGYILRSELEQVHILKYTCKVYLVNVKNIETDTEPEAIFKACEWILNEMDE